MLSALSAWTAQSCKFIIYYMKTWIKKYFKKTSSGIPGKHVLSFKIICSFWKSRETIQGQKVCKIIIYFMKLVSWETIEICLWRRMCNKMFQIKCFWTELQELEENFFLSFVACMQTSQSRQKSIFLLNCLIFTFLLITLLEKICIVPQNT